MSTFLSDLRLAARLLGRAPTFAITAILTLGIAIGASTAIFSVANPVLLQPLPYRNSERVMVVWERERDGSRSNVGFATIRDYIDRATTFESAAATGDWQPTLTEGTEAERLAGARVSSTYFRTLGVQPAFGRDFRADEDVPERPARRGSEPLALAATVRRRLRHRGEADLDWRHADDRYRRDAGGVRRRHHARRTDMARPRLRGHRSLRVSHVPSPPHGRATQAGRDRRACPERDVPRSQGDPGRACDGLRVGGRAGGAAQDGSHARVPAGDHRARRRRRPDAPHRDLERGEPPARPPRSAGRGVRDPNGVRCELAAADASAAHRGAASRTAWWAGRHRGGDGRDSGARQPAPAAAPAARRHPPRRGRTRSWLASSSWC